jgi:hypothetical protein
MTSFDIEGAARNVLGTGEDSAGHSQGYPTCFEDHQKENLLATPRE